MSSKVFPYSPRSKAYNDDLGSSQKSPSVKAPLSRGNSSQLEDFFEIDSSVQRTTSRGSFLDSSENSSSNVEKSPNVAARKHKNSIDFTNQKKEKKEKKEKKNPVKSPRSRGNSIEESNGSRPNSARSALTPRSKISTEDSATPPPLQRSNSRKGSTKKLGVKKGVRFRVPLEDRYGYDNTMESAMQSPEHSLSEEDYKKLQPKPGKEDPGGSGKTAGKTKAELRRMNRKRNRKHKKGCLPAIVRKCECMPVSCVVM